MKLDRQPVARRLLAVRLRLTDYAQGSARRIQVRRFLREKPALQLIDQLLFARGLLDLEETFVIAVTAQLARQRAPGAQEKEGDLFQAFLALGGQQARPPIG